MPPMNVATALVVIPALFMIIGFVPIRRRLQRWLPDQPVATPSPPVTMLLWLGSLAMFGAAVTLAGYEQESLLLFSLAVPLSSAAWMVLLIRRDQPRNAFFVLCSGWTISAIVAAWVYALDATASLLTVPLLLVLILGGVANFFIWQRPSSPDPTSG